ncbi:MAG: bifunctional diaminohydroxyphosphoribosylaminopyrimidine deaminase/5-amino-6-(5-phosphoribosylamino)uracil reductase RibD [Sphingobacteriales bacterium]|nr:bifunctional diaminohydroxyphosphoribosylaminopyrimidine deaminase/5-amino-6-(5-phosphoribosylamino)uracil reductase RibD [Sphingobacteriales bacterium]
MHRCIELAKLGAGKVAPNPMVGAVLVQDGKIISEGYHQQYGGPHAEVNAITRLNIANGGSLPGNEVMTQSTLYVSLEPCAHYGKTPPCVNLIIEKKIPKVVIGCRDPSTEVNGKGIEKLKAAGVEVELGILENECKELNKRFYTFHTQYRPYIILKWTETADSFIGNTDHSRLLISNPYTNRLVHQWRSEEAAILVGTNTALYDNPGLTVRLVEGNNPVRLVVDMDLSLPPQLKLFDKQTKTIVFNTIKQEEEENLLHYQITNDVSVVHQIANALYKLKLQSVLIEGGAKLLQSFIDAGYWDEARVITNRELKIAEGIAAPQLRYHKKLKEDQLLSDHIVFYQPEKNSH